MREVQLLRHKPTTVKNFPRVTWSRQFEVRHFEVWDLHIRNLDVGEFDIGRLHVGEFGELDLRHLLLDSMLLAKNTGEATHVSYWGAT